MIQEAHGNGGGLFDQTFGLPGSFVSANITPYNLKDWTDGEIYRAITSGVKKDGKAIFPVMPYPNYGQLDDEDIYAVIAYVRSLEPVEYDAPEAEFDFPVNLLINTMPKPGTPTKRPSSDDLVAYGKYMITAAGVLIAIHHLKREH